MLTKRYVASGPVRVFTADMLLAMMSRIRSYKLSSVFATDTVVSVVIFLYHFIFFT